MPLRFSPPFGPAPGRNPALAFNSDTRTKSPITTFTLIGKFKQKCLSGIELLVGNLDFGRSNTCPAPSFPGRSASRRWRYRSCTSHRQAAGRTDHEEEGRATTMPRIQTSGPLAKMLVMPRAIRPGMTATQQPAGSGRGKRGSAGRRGYPGNAETDPDAEHHQPHQRGALPVALEHCPACRKDSPMRVSSRAAARTKNWRSKPSRTIRTMKAKMNRNAQPMAAIVPATAMPLLPRSDADVDQHSQSQPAAPRR